MQQPQGPVVPSSPEQSTSLDVIVALDDEALSRVVGARALGPGSTWSAACVGPGNNW